MTKYILKIKLESDAAFGRGDGVAGLVDAEVQHDENGFPFLSGRTIKGLLVQECADILASLSAGGSDWEKAARRLFGRPGSSLDDNAVMVTGNALLPGDLRQAIISDIEEKRIRPEEVLALFTAARSQTAMDESGVPRNNSLRRIRVILRGTPFESELFFTEEPSVSDLALLAACVKAFRHAGTGITRGLGRLKADLLDQKRQTVTERYFKEFRKAVR